MILLPTTPIPAPPIADHLDNRVRGLLLNNTRLFNVLGTPACSVPCGFTAAGLPIGMTVAGQAFDEASVLEVALAYEQASEWKDRRPPIG